MNKPSRLSLIAALVTGGIAHSVNARPEEVREEISLASNPLDNDNNIEDEDTNHLASKELISRIDTASDSREGADSLLLNAKEQREIGNRKFFKVKGLNKVSEDESEVPEALDYVALAQWADASTV